MSPNTSHLSLENQVKELEKKAPAQETTKAPPPAPQELSRNMSQLDLPPFFWVADLSQGSDADFFSVKQITKSGIFLSNGVYLSFLFLAGSNYIWTVDRKIFNQFKLLK